MNDLHHRQELLRRASALLSTVDEQLEVMSIRRGGLQHMARVGMTVSEMRDFSKHSSDEMLMRNLAWGRVAVEHNLRLRELSDKMLVFC